jgi:hypothetical protein
MEVCYGNDVILVMVATLLLTVLNFPDAVAVSPDSQLRGWNSLRFPAMSLALCRSPRICLGES